MSDQPDRRPPTDAETARAAASSPSRRKWWIAAACVVLALLGVFVFIERNRKDELQIVEEQARQLTEAEHWISLGNGHLTSGRMAEARESLQEALKLVRKLRESDRVSPSLAIIEASVHADLSYVERESPPFDFDAALAHTRAGIALLEPLEKNDAINQQPNWKQILADHRQNATYLEWAKKALDPLEEVRARKSPVRALLLRARVMAARGRIAEAVATAEALETLPSTAASRLAAARAFALSGEPSAAKAVALLREAANQRVIPDPSTDPDFAALRNRADFKALVAEVEPANRTPPVAPPPREVKRPQ